MDDEQLKRYEADEQREPLRWWQVLGLLAVGAVFLTLLGGMVWLGGKVLEAEGAAHGESLRGNSSND